MGSKNCVECELRHLTAMRQQAGLEPKTITIPIAEYEGLKRRAFTLAELESFLLWGQRTNISPEEWEDDALLAKLTAVIKEQEG